MSFQIEIIEGHDPSSYFWFRPVILKGTGKILWNEIVELEEEFSIEEDDVDCYLSYFLYKYFDENLTYNKRRYEYGMGYINDFEWYLTHNFYTYDSLSEMVKEIEETAKLLETDYFNPRLDEIKESYPSVDICNQSGLDNNQAEEGIPKHISIVIDFYYRFAKRIISMMENNKSTTVISIMGP